MVNKRQKKILDLLQENSNVRILTLSKELKVSRETIRKDLVDMEKEGLLKKTYGGAVLDVSNSETDYDRRKEIEKAGKECIARKALDLVEEGDTIYLDYGTTIFTLAKELKKFEKLTVVTNSIPIINELKQSEGIELIILGGNLRKNEDSLFGTFAMNNLQNIYVDLGFFGCAGFDLGPGLTNYHMGELEVSKAMVSHSQTAILLADHTKFGQIALNKTVDVEELDIIITDKITKPKMFESIKGLGLEIFETGGKD